MECDFNVGRPGAIYARLIEAAYREKRIVEFPVADTLVLVELMTGMDARIGYPNEHLGQSKIEAVTSPLFATGVGLVMKGFEHLDNVRARIPAEAPARKSKVNTGSGIGSIFDKFIAKTSDLLSTDDDI